MHLFSKRPLLLALFCFLIVCVICAFTSHPVRFFCTIAFASATLIFAILSLLTAVQKQKTAGKIFTLFLSIFFCCIASISSLFFFDYKLAKIENLTTSVQIIGEVRECTFSTDYLSTYTVAVQEINGEKVEFNASLSMPEAAYLLPGNIISAEVSFNRFETSTNGYNERANNIADGILISGTFTNFELLKENSRSAWLFFFNLRKKIAQHIDNGAFQKSNGLLKALLIGDRDDLEDSISLDFRRLGISHILSISGTHFSTLLGMIAFLLSVFRVNKRFTYAILIPLAIFYMALTGFMPSVCRAGIMTMLSYIGILSGRPRDSYTALFLAVSGILIFQPYTVYNIGLWLSFTATFTILILLDLFNVLQKASAAAWYKKLLYIICMRLLISIFVTIFTMPIIATVFGETSFVSPIGNLLIVPAFEIFLYIAPISVIFANCLPLAKLTDLCYTAIMQAVDWICQSDNLLITLKPSFVFWITLTGCVVTLILLALPLKKRGFVLIPSCIGIVTVAIGLSVFLHIHSNNTQITYFTYKESDGIVLTDNNASLYIDISNGSSSPAYTAKDIAAENYSPELSGILFTHYHSYHVQTLRKLSNSVHIQKIYLPYATNEVSKNHMFDIEAMAERQELEIVRFSYGIPILFENCSITVLEPQYLSRTTHPVICLEIHAKNTDVLYLGSSFNDTKLDFSAIANRAEYIIYGQHHPVAKSPYSIVSAASPIYGSEDQYALSVNQQAGYILDINDQYEITLK